MQRVRDRDSDWRDETVTLTRKVRDIARTLLAMSKATTKLGHLDPEVAGLDHETPPGLRHQLALTHDFTRPRDQRNQDVQSSTSERNGYAVLHQDSCSWVKTEWSERHGHYELASNAFAAQRCDRAH